MLPPFADPADYPFIVWDDGAGRFRNTDTGAFVSNLSGIQTLRVAYGDNGPVFFDQAGNTAPDPLSLNFPGFSFDFLNATREFTPAEFNPYEQPAPDGSYHVTLFTYTDDEGNFRMGTIFSTGSKPISFEDEQRRIAAVIANELDIPTGAEGSGLVVQRTTRILHYIAT